MRMHRRKLALVCVTLLALVAMMSSAVPADLTRASSHREAPQIIYDQMADSTDTFAFVSPDVPNTVTLIADVIPLEAPNSGPIFYQFDDTVLYTINVDNVGDGIAHIQYQFRFTRQILNPATFLYNTGPINSLDDPDWNIRQVYTVTRVVTPVGGQPTTEVLGTNLPTPPVNIGPKSTPNYDTLANAAIQTLSDGTKVFAGQRDDPFYVDIGAIVDLLTIRKLPGNMGGGVDGLAGLNVHTIALQIPINRLTANGQAPSGATDPNAIIGVWQTTSRQTLSPTRQPSGDFQQVSRLGNPLVNEVVIPLRDKDKFNQQPLKAASGAGSDADYLQYVQDPEPARLFKALYNVNVPPTPRDDLVAIFLTGVPGATQRPQDVKTPSEQMRLNMAVPPTQNPNKYGVLAGDNAGYPNGRRVFDDVTDISLRAVAGAAYPLFHPEFKPDPLAGQLGDGVDGNDKPYLPVFPYVAPPHQGFEAAKAEIVVAAEFGGFYTRFDGPRTLGAPLSNLIQRNGYPAQYFEKAVLEDHARDQGIGESSPARYQYGLLVDELHQAKVNIPVGGDISTVSYAVLNQFADPSRRVDPPSGYPGNSTFQQSNGNVFVPFTANLSGGKGHNVPAYFWSYVNRKDLFPRGFLDELGLPITEPITATVTKNLPGGPVQREIVIQAFQRSILTYDRANPAEWQVERANVGTDYKIAFPDRVPD